MSSSANLSSHTKLGVSVPLARTKTAALARVLDLVPKGYSLHTQGEVPIRKLRKLLHKFHEKYLIGGTPAQRIARKRKGLANAMLVLYLPPLEGEVFATGLGAKLAASLGASYGAGNTIHSCTDCAPDPMQIHHLKNDALPIQIDADTRSKMGANVASAEWTDADLNTASSDATLKTLNDALDPKVSWLLLVTPGTGAVHDQECLRNVTDSNRLEWLGYELIRHATRGRTSWTWRRPKVAMEELFAVLDDQLNRRQYASVAATLERIARQPGFSGIREQSWRLCAHARQRGYEGVLPYLYFVEKTSPGLPIRFA